ncbi:MAG: CvpA family protein [Dehalococcoidia bacterium]|nr:CvpA family protein [Dehalococcoidia bacterium]MCL4232800.1 CvpA family protein [Dehalococcoidia bacterium]NUQ56143.1 CvpA family protein [Dehalococcoidia bacterium]
MNWITLVLLAVIGMMTFNGYRNGFIRELVGLCALILAVPLAGILYDDMYPKVEPIVDNEEAAALISFIAIMGGVLVGGVVVAHLLKKSVDMLNLGRLDDLAGGAFGFVKAAVLCQVVLIALVVFPSPDLREDIDSSPVATALLDAAPVVLAVLPGEFGDALDEFLQKVDEVADGLTPGETPTPVP